MANEHRIASDKLQDLLDNAAEGAWLTSTQAGQYGAWGLDTDGDNTYMGLFSENGCQIAIVAVESAFGMDDELAATANLMAASRDLAAEVIELRAQIAKEGTTK